MYPLLTFAGVYLTYWMGISPEIIPKMITDFEVSLGVCIYKHNNEVCMSAGSNLTFINYS